MKIKKVECESFAGIRDKDVRFFDGLNLIIGDNETGKTTLVDLIYNLFFQNTKIDKRQDKDFLDLYFPKTTGKFVSDSIDGKVFFETDNGEYKLEKEWSTAGGNTRLRNPDGTKISDITAIKNVLDNELKYGRGIYNELIFASQKRSATILKAILDNDTILKKAGDPQSSKEELASVIAKAVMESGGVEISKLEKMINVKKESYEGNWDFSINLPNRRRGIDNPFVKGNGLIIDAYYAKETVAKEVEKAIVTEKRIEDLSLKLANCKDEKRKLEDKREELLKYRDLLGQFNVLNKSIEDKRLILDSLNLAFEDWPKKLEELSNAQKLKIALDNAIISQQYSKAEEIRSTIIDIQKSMNQIGEIGSQELTDAKEYNTTIMSCNMQLSSINLRAKLHKIGSDDIDVYSLASGKMLEIKDNLVNISEAVKVVIPGVAEIELAPANIDADNVINILKENEAKLETILKMHNVSTFDELKTAKDNYDNLQKDLIRTKEKESAILTDMTYEELQVRKQLIAEEIEDAEVINCRIRELCNGSSIESFIGKVSGTAENYKMIYGDFDSLKRKIGEQNIEINKMVEQLKQFDTIPDEYKEMNDYDVYDLNLKAKISLYNDKIEEYARSLADAENELGDSSAEEYSEELIQKEEEFAKVKSEYDHWKHILQVFNDIKNSGNNNAIKDISNRFKEYLSSITEDGIELMNIDDNLNSKIVSGNSALSYGILSEGTKDTIHLAFRLAMLEYLFPNGGGLAVFDDPFTDMDEKRTKQACNLINKYAEKNQVIFVTCDSKYEDLLEGKVVELEI